MEVADGRRLTTHRSCFVRFPIISKSEVGTRNSESSDAIAAQSGFPNPNSEFVLVWTTTPWTLTSNVAAAVNADLDYVKVRTKRDGAVYYFAKDNLDSKRMEREFKEGFGRPEWQWPEGVPKLKNISQIFKEQGGYDVEGVLKGSDMIGWRYAGPFDDLEAQQQPGGHPSQCPLPAENPPVEAGGYHTDNAPPLGTGVSSHRVIDGGRDSKGQPNVVAGEGTGIVHIAPGCGDIDHKIGVELGLPIIAPLEEDGTYGEGFGPFTGREAIAPETAELVFEELRRKHLLVAVETYPHIYPHCWRTGDELVFRLVDEWLINMDWREEIREVTREINWLPASIDGEERELEWLTNMRDWMISKKRFWGLALPIWVDDQTGDFEVMGSLAELRERAVEGWDEFEGHTPHRPWIDRVKIRNPNTGNLMSRIPDVGNPWLDAGIVPFSTMQYNHNREEWARWFPADLITECFPGQFRNWFYSLLTLATMMRYDETDDPCEKRPFRNLLGHRLVMDENGKPMHKSDGTAIWFEEAAEQLGVDTLRWLYLAQPPASDLRFGTRHPDEPLTLETPVGPISQTREGLPTCRVTSRPADEVRRQVLIPLWNSYSFFVNYAVADEFDPSREPVPLAERPEIDRWILSRLQELTGTAREAFESFDAARFVHAAAEYIDDLSNWYIRRNRRRFWRTKDAGDSDKLAAYQTLHEVLVTLTKLLAPCIPFLAERVYQNLVVACDTSAPESVHLCDYPAVDQSRLDPDLNWKSKQVQTLVRVAHRVREAAEQRVRQPLAELRYVTADPRQAQALAEYHATIADELNIKQIVRVDNLDELVSYSAKPNLKTLGPRYGKLLASLRTEVPNLSSSQLSTLRQGQPVLISLDGQEVVLEPNDVLISTQQASDWRCADESGIQVAISTALTDELLREGMARDFVRHVQQARKDAELDITDRICIDYQTDGPLAAMAISEWDEYIRAETLADVLQPGDHAESMARPVTIGSESVTVSICRAI